MGVGSVGGEPLRAPSLLLGIGGCVVPQLLQLAGADLCAVRLCTRI